MVTDKNITALGMERQFLTCKAKGAVAGKEEVGAKIAHTAKKNKGHKNVVNLNGRYSHLRKTYDGNLHISNKQVGVLIVDAGNGLVGN